MGDPPDQTDDPDRDAARAEVERLRAVAAELQAAVVQGRVVIDQARELLKEMDASRQASE